MAIDFPWPWKKPALEEPARHPPVSKPHEGGIDAIAFLDIFKNAFDGEPFPGALGRKLVICDDNGHIDYRKLRDYSVQLFTENSNAIGLINRLLTNVINTGLKLQAQPEASVLGIPSEEAREWGDWIESRFKLYAGDKDLIDFEQERRFGPLQDAAKLSAYLAGDCLVTIEVDSVLRMPQVRLFSGRYVMSPLDQVYEGRRIVHGVELDARNRHVAYWLKTAGSLEPVRVPARNKSGQRVAWLLYAGRRRIGQVRGIPLLASVMYALADIKKYGDAEIRAAWVNALFAVWVKRDLDAVPTVSPLGRSAVRKTSVESDNPDGTTQKRNISWHRPGMMLENLNPGESVMSFDTKRPNINYEAFTKSVLAGVAWANEIPPEIYFLTFQSNFSASRQASNEFNMFLIRARDEFAAGFCQPIYEMWLKMYALSGKVVAPGYVESLRNPLDWETRNAWEQAEWIGVSRPSVDILKEVNAYAKQIDYGLISREQAATEMHGRDWHKTADKIISEKSILDEMQGSPEPEPTEGMEDGEENQN